MGDPHREKGEQLIRLFDALVSASHSEREALFARLGADDPDLADELRTLLDAHEHSPLDLEELASATLPGLLRQVAGDLASSRRSQDVAGRYRLLECLGRGGMGEVWRALDLVLDREVALKFLSGSFPSGDVERRRVLAEARAASKLDHPGIAVIHEVSALPPEGDSGGEQPYIAMAYCPGETLARKLADGPIDPDLAVDIAAQAADALAAAHAAGVVHMDIKPSNLILGPTGRAKLVDFGLASRVSTGPATGHGGVGTPAYMSPEQAAGGEVDGRSDIWSLGVVLYEMVTGRRPFGDDGYGPVSSRREGVAGVGTAPSAETSEQFLSAVPDALRDVVRKSLAPRADERYPDATRLRDALLEAGETMAGVAGNGAEAAGTSPAVGAPRRRVASMLAAAGVITAVVGGGLYLWSAGAGDGGAAATGGAPDIAVLPFVPVTADTALERLGRRLSVEAAASLDGMGELSVVDVIDLLNSVPTANGGEPEVASIARRTGAARVVRGVLTRQRDSLHLDLSLHATGNPRAIVRAAASRGGPDGLANAAVIALLDELWAVEPPEVPSLAHIRRSRDPAARRAFLEGEIAMLRADMPSALAAFERAFAADTTLWWAYWRSLYVRQFREVDAPPDSAVIRKVLDHRDELPRPDRLLLDAALSDSNTEMLIRLRQLVTRYDRYPPGWWAYANLLVHSGPFLGQTAEDAHYALQQYLALRPRAANAWDHLVWVALVRGDSATAVLAAAAADSLTSGVPARRLWVRIQNNRASSTPAGRVTQATLAEALEILRISPPFLAEAAFVGWVGDGRPEAQLQLNQAARGHVRPGLTNALLRGNALAWAARGGWDSALVAARRWSSVAEDEADLLGPYRLAAVAVALGYVQPELAATVRPPPAAVGSLSAFGRAELQWLDGLVSFGRGDPHGLGEARAGLAEEGPSVPSELDRSLAALERAAVGETAAAARGLATLEREIADGPLAEVLRRAPALSSVHRLLAARWLRDQGRDAEAARLLAWFEAIPAQPVTQAWLRSLGGVALLDRAELALASGDAERSIRLLDRFEAQYDLANDSLRARAERVRDAAALEERDGLR